MPEIQRSSETNDNLKEDSSFNFICDLLKSRLGRIFILALLTMVIACARKKIHLTPDQCNDYRVKTHRNADGSHGVDEAVVFLGNPSSKGFKEVLCHVKEKCRNLKKDEEQPEPKDCIDWSKPCVEL